MGTRPGGKPEDEEEPSLHARIAQLEEVHQQAIRARNCSAEGGSAIKKIRQYLSERGIEQAGTESLAETFARALGISGSELRVRLQRRAAGLPAE
jgi:hypothetical protein